MWSEGRIRARVRYIYEHLMKRCRVPDPAQDTILLLEKKMIQRAIDDPKPMYYQEDFLDQQLSLYLAEAGLSDPGKMVPDDFVRWIFPRHVEHRRPKYQAIADAFGYTIDARAAENVESDSDFLELIAGALG